jgi:ketosteroid isomerase-like protein
MSNCKQGEAIGAFMRYVEVFERLDPQAIASYYNEPALLISPQGIASLPTSAYVEQFFDSVMADLKAQGYARSEFLRLAEDYLSNELALCERNWRLEEGVRRTTRPVRANLYSSPNPSVVANCCGDNSR